MLLIDFIVFISNYKTLFFYCCYPILNEDYFTRKLYIQRINIILTFYFNKFPVSCLLSEIPYKSKFSCYTKGKKITFKDMAWKWAELHI